MADYINHINIGSSDYLIKDTTHPEIKFYYPTGTAAVTTSPYYCARYDVTDTEVIAYQDGMMVWFEVPVAGNGTYGTALQINSLGYKPIVCDTNTPIGNRYSVGSRIWCIYNSTQTATLYINSATATTITGCWQVMDYSSEHEELFICTTSTTYSEVTAAIAAGKIPVLYDGSSGLVAFLSGGDDGDVVPYYSFSGQVGTYGVTAFVTYRLLNTDVWQPDDSYYVSPASIDDTSTNNQIPTALAVYNALSSAGGGSSLYYDQITLNTSSWSSNQYTATVSGMTSTAIVWVNPTDDSKTYWTRANVRATSQSLDTLVFTCTDQELASYTSLNVNVVWTEPANQN